MKRKKLTTAQKWGFVFISPWVIFFLVFLVYPLVLAVKNSFLNINLLQPEKATFVGFGNWINTVCDPLFWKSIVNIIYNQTIFILLTFVISLLFAILLSEIKFGASIFRTMYFLPVITSLTVAMLVFESISGPSGSIQQALMKIGFIHQAVFWKNSKWLPMAVIAIFNSWKWFGIQMIIFIGGIASIDTQVFEAAQIDGAGWFRRLRSVTLPLLKPQIVFVLTMNIINGLQMFTEVYMSFDLTGGVYHSALTPVMYLYSKGFEKMQMGSASAVGLVLAIIIFVSTQVQMFITNGRDKGEA